MGAGNAGCGLDWQPKMHFFTFWLLFGSILGVFGWILGAPGFRVGTVWVQIGHNACKLRYWESLLVLPGCTLGGLGSSMIAFVGHSVSVSVPWASKIDAAGDKADIAKIIANHVFLWFFETWRVILEAWRSSRSGLLAHWMASGWLAGGLAGGGWGWLGGWLATGPPGAERSRSG